jgi:hypothetical protein
MADKYTLHQLSDIEFLLLDNKRHETIAWMKCTQDIANLLDKCLNQTSRAGSVKSKAKREASKRNIAKRWNNAKG